MTEKHAEYFAGLDDEELLKKLTPGHLLDEVHAIARAEAVTRGLEVPPAVVEVEPPAFADYPGDFVAVARLLEPTEAHLLRAYLESCEIPAVVADVNLVQAHQLLTPALGGASVRVPSRFAGQARELLRLFSAGQAALDEKAGESMEGISESSPPPELHRTQKTYWVYQRPDRPVPLVVKQGFSWGAFFFGPLWFLAHGMWSYFWIAAALYLGGHLYFQSHIASSQPDGLMMLGGGVLYLLTWFCIGKLSHLLLSIALEDKGYRLIAKVQAKNSTYARDEATRSAT